MQLTANYNTKWAITVHLPRCSKKAVTAAFHTLHTSRTEQSQFGISMQNSRLYSELLSMDLEQYFLTTGEHKVKQLHTVVSL